MTKPWILFSSGFLAATLLALAVRYYYPKVVLQTTTKTQVVTKHDTRTVTRIIEHKDGTKETVIDAVSSSTEDKSKAKIAAKVTKWHASVAAKKNISELEKTVYQIGAEYKILGPLYVGALLSTDSQIGLIIGLEF